MVVEFAGVVLTFPNVTKRTCVLNQLVRPPFPFTQSIRINTAAVPITDRIPDGSVTSES